jgi:N-acetylated-alpha-linked acidic dipeptidase
MRRGLAALTSGVIAFGTTLLSSSAAAIAAPPGVALFGFDPETSPGEQALEQRFDSQLDPVEMTGWLKSLSSQANQVGSPHDKANAEWVRDQLRKWGWNAQIEQFDVLYPTLEHHSLELTAPTHFTAALNEPPVAGDATSARTDGMAPYNTYGGDGDVTGELVYANYGMDDDYKDLARRSIDVKGKIVIVRYGGGWRGLKPKLAQEHGAAGCIIYSDPRDDGYAAGEVYPKGGWRPPAGVQRGSVSDMPVYPGDPLTPGYGSTKNAKRLSIAQAKSVLKIPVMPISYGDAQPLLAAIGGPLAPERWRGALPITYNIGPGPATVHMVIRSNWGQKPLYDVIARIPGSEQPDEWVIRANHRDAWVFGAWDPLSGHVSMLAEAKAIGSLLQSGWRPKRTLVYASWDGEEPGLLGSTEWAETHAEELQKKAVVYINSDTNTRGFLNPGGSHSLQRLVNDVAESVPDPETHVSVEARERARAMVQGFERGASEAQRKIARTAAAHGDLPLEGLGSGSDYSPFLQHLGVASLNIEFGGEAEQSGVYHSQYDTFEHYMRFGDPGFLYEVAEAKTVGRLALRMADADVLPMQFTGFADTVGQYLDEVHKLVDERRRSAEELGKLLDQNAFTAASDPTKPVAPPEREPEVPYFEFASLDNVLARLQKSARGYDELYAKVSDGSLKLTVTQRRQLDDLLRGLEQTLTDSRGLPGRDWYRHLIYAPGMLTGYGVKTLPGVREAIEQDRFEEAGRYIPITAAALGAYCDRLDQAAAVLNRAAAGEPAPKAASLAAR